jgi:sterol desaturase/sphingolipid hydroxylase (fatty acid hydroxylase superfamily)
VRAIALILGSWLLAEFYGYWLHVLLHSDRWRWLSQRHMNHHLLSYHPGGGMRSDTYVQETGDHLLIAGLGAEWFAPAAGLIALTALGEWAIGLTWLEILASEAMLLSYSIFLFWYLHDRMHLKDIWLLRNPLLRKWFLKTRRNHDVHHHHITDDGLMQKNFGIAFPLFDHVFRTYQPRLEILNRRGIEAAYDRYDIPR